MEDYQTFVPDYPRVRLTTLPTPLERALRLEAALRAEGLASVPKLYIKRDDLLSLGLGGNKVRNLEFSFGEAIARGATDIVTSGRQQSNHCRLTAAAGARTGLRAHVVLTGERAERLSGNLLLDELFGASMHFAGSNERAEREALVERVAADIRERGGTPYVIPVGGSNARGALGHALAALEVYEQVAATGERLAAVVLATATGGTQAGMLAGLRKLGSDAAVFGFAVAFTAEELRERVASIVGEVAREIGARAIRDAEVLVDGAQLGEGYGAPTAASAAAIEMLAQTEGLVADPVYTGKGLAGLLARVRGGRFSADDAVVFVHTGGVPAMFA